ncbi:MAG TPA: isochorismate synthase [Bacillota bacterium]|nr:isochorismate synthase [Bacillota bacterium]
MAAWLDPRPARGVLRSRVCEVAPGDPVTEFVSGWLRTGRGFLWWRPGEGFALAGTGRAAAWVPQAGMHLAAVDAWWTQLRASSRQVGGSGEPATGPLLFSGLAFDPTDDRLATDPDWRAFPPLAAVVPARMATLRGGRAWLTLNDLGEDGPVEPSPTMLPSRPAPAIASVTDLPTAAAWSRRVGQLVGQLNEAFSRGEAEKVVLARSKRVLASAAFAPEHVLRRLAVDHAQSTVFAVGWGDRLFLGATPELLVSTRGTAVRSASLAGSRPRGQSPERDQALAADLLASDKDRREHAFVVAAITAGLRPLSRSVETADAPTILRLPNVQHLLTEVTAEAKAPGALLQLVERLHPTPAVGGVPRAAAVAAIRRLEVRPRGWYAGTVGWVDASGDGDFVVALRSGVLRGRRALLYAGCGIVAGSNPEHEFAEAEVKFAPLLAALGAASL